VNANHVVPFNHAKKISCALVLGVTVWLYPQSAGAQRWLPDGSAAAAAAQNNTPAAVQRAEADAERTARRLRLGIQGGVGLDPELIDIGVHSTIGPIFKRSLAFRPGVEIGVGELTTLFGINLDVLYSFPGATRDTDWIPYVGAGPTFGLSHRGFETDDVDNVDGVDDQDSPNRFDFSDTDFNGGMNFIVGMHKPSGVFFEMKATAWGVSNIRLLAGFHF
jgi:hypothetical protein